MKKKVLALGLRGISMGAKFLLVIGLSKELSISDYGVFSLIITSLTFLIFFLGLDFYNFSHREIIEKNHKKFQYILNQFGFHVFCYVLYLPIIYLIFSIGIIPIEYLIPFYILLILEHIGQELFRFFNLFNRHNQANISLFIRTAFWIAIMLGLEYFVFKRQLSVFNILIYWISGSFIAIIYSIIYVLLRIRPKISSLGLIKIDKSWIKKGIKISVPFFLGTIAYKIIEYSDRYMIDLILGKEQVGVYSFYTNFANIVNIVVNTITITLLVPNILRVVEHGKLNEIKSKTKHFQKEIIITTLIVAFIVAVFIFPVIDWVKKEEYSNEVSVYFIVLFANVIFNISLFYHFLLYAYKKDSLILKPTIIASLTNIILNVIFIPMFGIIAAAISTLISFSIILILKKQYWKKVNP